MDIKKEYNKMVGIYLSGTGNTRHCIENLVGLLDASADKLKISDECIGCGLCVRNCPMKNLQMPDSGKPVQKGKCTMCYRCISHCPEQAITLLGERVVEQTVVEKFIEQ